MRCRSKFCGDEIKNDEKFRYKGLCHACSIGEKVWRKIKKNVNHEKKENSQQQNVSEGVGNSNTLKIMPTASVDTIQDVKLGNQE